MPWLRFEDNFPEHPKILAVSDAAFRLHIRAIAYCSRLLTDGELSESAIHAMKTGRWGDRLANELVEAGLWEKHGKTWRIHDYLTYQPSKSDTEARRKADRERKHPTGFRPDSEGNLRGIR